MGFAYYTTLAADESFTMLELKINFLRPVWKATLRAKARLVHAGRFVGYVEWQVVDEQERLVARASSTCLPLGDSSPKDAGDRRSQREHLGRDRDPMSRSKNQIASHYKEQENCIHRRRNYEKGALRNLRCSRLPNLGKSAAESVR
jgi:hypothetical protein